MKRFLHLHQALGLVWRSARGWTALQIGTMVVQGALPIASLMLTKRVVDALTDFLAQPQGARSPAELMALAPLVVLVALVGWGARAVSSLVSAAQSEAIADHVQDTIQSKSMELDLARFETPHFYNQIRMAQSEASSRPSSIVRNLVQLGVGGFALCSIMGVIGYEHSYLLPVLLVAALPGAVARIRNARLQNRWREEQNEPQRYAHYLNMLLTALPFAKEIRLFAVGGELRKQYRKLRRRLRRSRLRMVWRRTVWETAANALAAAAMVAGLGMIYIGLMRDGTMSLGDLALLYSGMQRGKSAFSKAFGSLASLYEDALFIGHYYAFLAMPRRVCSPAKPRAIPRSIVEGIRLENVCFTYPETEREVLHDLSFDIRAGEHVALVGENGCGKTTLIKLLCRLYDPSAGRILLDGMDIREFALEDLYKLYTGLFQDFVRYQMSVEDNIRMGNIAVPPDDPAIREAAHRAGTEPAIRDLPHGYKTLLGRLFEGGAEMSEGQWQRLALARVLLRDAPIVLLDEPTSSLDARAERELLHAFRKSLEGRTAVMVSHRLITVKSADRILMLTDGRLVETGTHTELLQRNGAYADLFARHDEREEGKKGQGEG